MRAPASWVLGLLLLCTHCMPATARARKAHRTSRSIQAKRRECERGSCLKLPEDDRPNCVLRCQSAMCYQKIYGEEELEPGEIDLRRNRMFTACLSTEERDSRRQKVRERYPGNSKQPSASTRSPFAAEVAELAAAAVSGGEAVVDGAAGDDVDDPGEDVGSEADEQPDGLQLEGEEEEGTPLGVAEEL